MTGNSTLKIAAAISLGIHLLFLGIASNLFQNPKVLRLPTRYVTVTLLPLVAQQKPHAKITLPIPLKVGNQDRMEPVFDRKGLDQDPFLSHPSVAKNISFEEPKSILKNKEEEQRISIEPVNIAMIPGSVSETDSNLENKGNTVSSKEATSTGGDLFISLPSSRSGESYGSTFSNNGSGDGSGTGPGNGGSSKGGSGKGEGILGRIFSSLGGGNGARPRYAENPKPIYPQEAKKKRYEGEVVLRVEVLINGRVGQIEIKKSSGYESLDHSALTTVKQWRFIPAKKDETPIPLWVNIPVKFQLQ